MAKIRIYELAKQIGIESKVIINKLKEFGLDVHTHMSSLDSQTVSMLKKALELEKTEKKKEAQKRQKKETERKPSPKTSQPRSSAARRRRRKKEKRQAPAPVATEPACPSEEGTVYIAQAVGVGELAKGMNEPVASVLTELIKRGIPAQKNSVLDFETAQAIASEFGYEIKHKDDIPEDQRICTEEEGEGQPRHPVVTIMGHVDHGKTSLLDYIRKSTIVEGEKGGITQHIGAYYVEVNQKKITFLDTPGHEAFTSMRARGAQVTDIVVLIVAADEGVKPQTKEAVNHAKAAGVPIIVAINKIDKENANVDKAKQDITTVGLVPEEWGGETIVVEVSAKTGKGVSDLLEMILLQAEMLELKAPYKGPARGVVIESKLDPRRGPIATVLITQGRLRQGDPFVAGSNCGRVKAMRGTRIKRYNQVGPSIPVEIMGFNGVCQPGDSFIVVESDKIAKCIAGQRQEKVKEASFKQRERISLENLFEQINKGNLKQLNVILKCDVQGSVQAIVDGLNKQKSDKVNINIISTGVGPISENDITLAEASDAIVIGFNNRLDINARKQAEVSGVSVSIYNVIYKLFDEVKQAMEGLLEPILEKVYQGTTEIRKIFKVPKIGKVAGCMVLDGKITRNSMVKVLRDDVQIYEGKLSSLKRFKDDVREVVQGYECGLGIENFADIKEGDILESYEITEKKQEL